MSQWGGDDEVESGRFCVENRLKTGQLSAPSRVWGGREVGYTV